VNSYLVMPIVQSIFAIILLVFIIRGHAHNPVHRLFSLYLLALAVWGGLIFAMRASPDIEHAYTWERALTPVAPLLAVILYHFAIRFTRTRVASWRLPLAYLICLSFASIAGTQFVFVGMQTRPFGYAPIPGPAMVPWTLFSYAMMILVLFVLFKSLRTAKSAVQRNRSAYIFIGVVISLVGGAFDVLTLAGLPLYPGAIIGNIIFCLLTTVAIVRHNLLDIRVVLRKGAAYVLTSAVVAVPFVAIFLLATRVFTEGEFPFWAYFIVAIVLALILPQSWQWVQRWVDRWYYRDRYDYLKALENFSRQTQSLTDSTVLGYTMVNLIAKALRISNVYLLQPLPYSGDFAMAFSTGLSNTDPVIQLNKGSALVNWLERSGSMLPNEDIEIIPQLQGITSKERETLEHMSTEFIVPLKASNGQLSGILILGKKLSEQPYNSEDKQLIYTICTQMSTNLENVRLYNESLREVNERKRAEQELQAEKNKLSSIIYAMEDYLTIMDTDYNLIFQNELSKQLFGDQFGEKCYRVFENQDNICEGCPVELAFKYGHSHVAERRVVTPSGEVIFLENAASLIRGAKGEVVACLEISRNITERKQAGAREKELQRELYLSSRLASIGELAAGVAHQINNPLTGVLGFSQRLLRKSTDHGVKQDLERIYSEAERAAKIVQNLLTFARRRQPKKEYSDVNNIVLSALELRDYELKINNIEVVTSLDPKLPKIMLDFHQIQEVFLNIILNAEQAMTDAKSVGRLTIKTEEKKGYIRTTFTDDGPGIPAEHLDKIFDPFYTTKGERGGTGLGLSVCHGIVTEHGGKIYAKSKPSKGTIFFVELPIIREAKDASRVVYKRKPTPIE
jgi:signal transduction histidine kinase